MCLHRRCFAAILLLGEALAWTASPSFSGSTARRGAGAVVHMQIPKTKTGNDYLPALRASVPCGVSLPSSPEMSR